MPKAIKIPNRREKIMEPIVLARIVGYINPLLYLFKSFLYRTKAFHDTMQGDNTYPIDNPVLGYMATRG